MSLKTNIMNGLKNGIIKGLQQGTQAGAQLGAAMYEKTAETVGNVANEANEINNDVLETVGAKPATITAAKQVHINGEEKQNNTVKDETDTNIEKDILSSSWQDYAKEMQERQWAREDAIRKETQEREDNAWQRAVADMQKAGVNPNLVNASPAASGGGITSATGQDYTVYEKEMEKELALLEQYLDQEFKANENQKDRITDIISKLIGMGGVFAALKPKT